MGYRPVRVYSFPEITLGGRIFVALKRLRQILVNLIGNAFKYTRKGLIQFSVEEGNHCCTFSITDTGIGIPHDQLEKIFLPFYQYVGERGFVEGAGLGLSICRELLRLMGSDLLVKSEPGRVSSFWFHLQLQKYGEISTIPPEEKSTENAPEPVDTSMLPPPDPEVIHTCLSYARIGDIRGIKRFGEDLKTRAPVHKPFADLLIELARNYRLREIKELLHQWDDSKNAG